MWRVGLSKSACPAGGRVSLERLCLLHYSHPRAKHKQTPENSHPKFGEEGGATLLKVSDRILATR